MTDEDGLRLEAAEQFGASAHALGDNDLYLFTAEQVVAFAKGCERAGLAKALADITAAQKISGDLHEAVILTDRAYAIEVRIAALDKDIRPALAKVCPSIPKQDATP